MRWSFEVTCPVCGAEPEPGPSEDTATRVKRAAMSCRCGWRGQATVSLVDVPLARLGYVERRRVVA